MRLFGSKRGVTVASTSQSGLAAKQLLRPVHFQRVRKVGSWHERRFRCSSGRPRGPCAATSPPFPTPRSFTSTAADGTTQAEKARSRAPPFGSLTRLSAASTALMCTPGGSPPPCHSFSTARTRGPSGLCSIGSPIMEASSRRRIDYPFAQGFAWLSDRNGVSWWFSVVPD